MVTLLISKTLKKNFANRHIMYNKAVVEYIK